MTLAVGYSGPLDAAADRPRGGWSSRQQVRHPASRGGGDAARGELPLQQPQLLVPAAGDARATPPATHAADGAAGLGASPRAASRPVASSRCRAPRGPRLRQFRFVARQPSRYLSCLVTPLATASGRNGASGSSRGRASRAAPARRLLRRRAADRRAQPRLQSRARDLARTTADILRFYTLARRRLRLPDPHARRGRAAPAGRPQPGLPGGARAARRRRRRCSYRDDPASFSDFPEFFLAHELAHQWWGQAVGWKNYHEQWLSEGFAQYFAALYAEQARGAGRLRQHDAAHAAVRRWRSRTRARSTSATGSATSAATAALFRAVVYNKGAVVLHMLRRLVGDEAFFRGVRRFYDDWRFQQGRHRRLAAGDGGRGAARRSTASSSAGSTATRCRRCRSPGGSRRATDGRSEAVVRFEQTGRGLRRAGHRDPRLRRPAGRGHAREGHGPGGRAPRPAHRDLRSSPRTRTG